MSEPFKVEASWDGEKSSRRQLSLKALQSIKEKEETNLKMPQKEKKVALCIGQEINLLLT